MTSEMFVFEVFHPQEGRTFSEQMDSVEKQLRKWMEVHHLSDSDLLLSRSYLSDAANQLAVWKASALYAEILSAGGVSFIEQPNIDASKFSLWVWFVQGSHLQKKGSPDQMEFRLGSDRLFFHSVRFTAADVEGTGGCAQTELAFGRHAKWLAEKGLNLRDHCLRTWLYVRDIDRHYASVVEGRNRVFAAEGLTPQTHFIASTGIGGDTGCREAIVAIDFLSADLSQPQIHQLQALEYLNPTIEYGVAFERGTSVTMARQRLHFISGTASIDKYGQCLHQGDVVTQTGRLLLNMEKLLNDDKASLSDLVHIVVYLRDWADAAVVREYFRLRFPHLPMSMVLGRVCRPEWLIEVEGIALSAQGSTASES